MRRFAALFLSILLLCVPSSCSKEENNFYYDVFDAPLNLDPQSAYDSTSLLLVQNLFEGLTYIDRDGKPQLGIAESLVVLDGETTYLFTLKDGVCWADGTPLTAEDVVFAFRRLLDPNTQAPFASEFLCIKNAAAVLSGELHPAFVGVAARDEDTVVFTLEEPDDDFLQLLSTAAAMPCSEEFFNETRGKYGLEKNMIMGNGAFSISSWQKTYITLRASENYLAETPVTADFVRINFLNEMESKKTLQQRFAGGDTSAAFCSGEGMRFDSDWTVDEKQNTVWVLVFSEDSSVFSPAMRKALAYSCDLSRLEGVLPDYLTAADRFVPGENSSGEDDSLRLAYSPEDAAACLAEGLSQMDAAALSSVSLILPENSFDEEYLSYLIQGWQKELKLYFSVEVLPQEQYLSRLAGGNFDCALVSSSGSGDPEDLLNALCDHPTMKIVSPASGVFQAAMEAGKNAEDETEKQIYFRKAEEAMLREAAALPICFETTYFLQGEGVSGLLYSFDTGLVDFKYGKIS